MNCSYQSLTLSAKKKEMVWSINLLGIVKRLAAAKKGIYDGLAAVEQAPSSEIAKEYVAIADMLMAGKTEREDLCHE